MSEGTVDKVLIDVRAADGSTQGSFDLDPRVFAAAQYDRCVHQTVVWQRNKRRAGTHATITKGMMKGGGQKPWQQKGTGRARAGSSTSPVWVGGGVAHGPQPRDYSTRQNRKERTRALATVLTQKLAAQELVIVAGFEVGSGKTKDAMAALSRIGVDGSKGVCFVMDSMDAATARSLRNIPGVLVRGSEGINVYDILNHGVIVSDRETVGRIQAQLVDRLA